MVPVAAINAGVAAHAAAVSRNFRLEEVFIGYSGLQNVPDAFLWSLKISRSGEGDESFPGITGLLNGRNNFPGIQEKLKLYTLW